MAAKRKNTRPGKAKPTQPPDRARRPPEQSRTLSADAVPVEGQPERPGLPVVGIGASAGGLDALQKLFAAMPPGDIGDREQAEEALRRTEQRFRLMADHAPVMIWISGTDKLCTWFNKPWLDFTGRTMDEELGDGWSRGVHREDLDRCLKTYAAHVDARTRFTMEYRLRRYDGEYRWILDTGVPLAGEGDEFTGYIGSCIDISDRKRAEEELQQSEARTRRLLEYHQAIMANMGEGLYTLDTQGAVTYMNPAAESLLGWKSAELLGRRMHDVIHYHRPDGRPFPIEECAGFQVLHEGNVLKDHDDVFIRRDGSFFPVILSSSPLISQGRMAGLVVVFRDMTDRKRAEEELQRLSIELRARVEDLTTLLDILRNSSLNKLRAFRCRCSMSLRLAGVLSYKSRRREDICTLLPCVTFFKE